MCSEIVWRVLSWRGGRVSFELKRRVEKSDKELGNISQQKVEAYSPTIDRESISSLGKAAAELPHSKLVTFRGNSTREDL